MSDVELKLAKGIKALQKQAEDLRAQLALHEKSAQAEEILLAARHTNAPDSVRPKTIDDFLAKRAQLETSSEDHIQKIATIVDLYDHDEDSITLSDEVGETERGDLTTWLRKQI